MKAILLIVILLLGNLPHIATAASYQSAVEQLQQQLELAQQKYSQEVKTITAARAPSLKKLHKLEQQLLGLRAQLAADIRAKDEQYLSLQQIQTRLRQWQDQNRFIHNQLNSVTNSQAQNSSALTAIFQQRLQALSAKLSPQWRQSDAVQTSGEVVAGSQLTVGPLSWFKHDEQLYLSELSANKTSLTIAIDAAEKHEALTTQFNHAEAGQNEQQVNWLWLETDITAGKATAIAGEQVSYWQKLQVGGIWSYPILAFGTIALLMGLVKLMQVLRLPKLDAAYAQQLMAQPLTQELLKQELLVTERFQWQQQLAALAWQARSYDVEKTNDQLFALLMQFKGQLERGMSLLAATAAVAPLLGLLGTVSGMIHTFEMMNLFGNKDQSLLSGGISEALFTTELGLIVAIPALLAHAYLSRKHQSYLSQLENDSVLLAHLGKPNSGDVAC